MPAQLRRMNWWIGAIFAIGSACFVVASCLSLAPGWAKWLGLESYINAIFFVGSVPFTIAAWLQLHLVANTEAQPPSGSRWRRVWIGWRPSDHGWLGCMLQFVGTLLFNVNTFDAMSPSINWFQHDLEVWLPDIVGSILFLASGSLAYTESNRLRGALGPNQWTQSVVFINLFGCIGFMISACFALALPETPSSLIVISTAFTLQGAVCFLIGSLMMLPRCYAST